MGPLSPLRPYLPPNKQVAQRAFLNPREVRKTAITTRIMQLVHEVLSKVCK